MIRDTSIEAYRELRESQRLNHDCGILFDAIINLRERFGRWPTDKEIRRECSTLDKLKNWESNQVTGRRGDLIRIGMVREGEKRQCQITGRLVYTWEIMYPTAELQGTI
ncbi:MAG: hypothetical protein RLN82_09785 [Pseudomonadales bacterium]|uniref:hypothetical protein n=1 Tax=Ekhidna sp. TaxID=2608089 RepID=UPI0032EACA21